MKSRAGDSSLRIKSLSVLVSAKRPDGSITKGIEKSNSVVVIIESIGSFG